MKHFAKVANFRPLQRLYRRFNNRGAIAPIAAVLMTLLVVTAGAGIDLGRQVQLQGALQDAADSAALAGITQTTSAAAISAAKSYVSAAAASIPGNPTVSGAYAYDNTTNATAPTMTVTLTASIPTTLLAVMTKTLNGAATAKASGTLARKVTITVSNFNSSAADLNQIYYYLYASSLTGTALYATTPTLSASPILSNNPNAKLTGSTTFSVALGYSVGFALSNTTGGLSNYGSNCYGQAKGTTIIYYSHREDSAGSYWDYNVPSFTACTAGGNNWSAKIASNGVTELAPCNSSDASVVDSIGTCSSSATYPAGNYVYYTDSNPAYKPYDALYGTAYSRNPLRYGSTNTDCTAGDVIYQWDDNGGTTDDNDYNDAVFTANCTNLVVSNTTVKLYQ